MPMVLLDGVRVFLRPPSLEDFQSWVFIRRRNKAYLEPFEPRWSAQWYARDFFERRLARQARSWHVGQAQSFLIFKKDHTLIGGMNVNNICRGAAQYASLGYWIDEDHQGQGYMSEALALTVAHCFGNLNLNRIHGACLVHNERSRNLLVRAGFTKEGLARKYLQIDCLWQDHILYGLTQEDWESSLSGISG